MFDKILSAAATAVSKGASALQEGAERVKKAQENAGIISEEFPLTTAGLVVYPNRFKYKDKVELFSSVISVSLTWNSTTTNVIYNEQNVLLYIKTESNSYVIKKTTMYVAPKLVKAYQYIAQKTFEFRLQPYLEELKNNGFMEIFATHYFKTPGFFGKKDKNSVVALKIYTDGRVAFSDKKMSIFDANISKNHISIRINSEEFVLIALDSNADVVLAIVNFILQNPITPNEYVENHRRRNQKKQNANIFIDNCMSLMAKLAYADGTVSQEEVGVVFSFLNDTLQLDHTDQKNAIDVFNSAKNSINPFEYYAYELLNNFESDLLSIVLDFLFFIAAADGTLSAEEELLLLEAESIFGIEGRAYGEFKSKYNHKKSNDRAYYLEVLGLSPEATIDEIKRTYKRLAMKFHPDRVNHLGDNFVKEAESKMQEINAAYEFLNKK